ncbi:MAG TPA: FxLYD domain-containing protein [Candidatus Nitrosotenuis sp.]|nr:FxLYD domain-containing protein [Candidatus Nitrosotenuis sp.]
MQHEEKSKFPVAFLAGIAVMLLLLGIVYVLTKTTQTPLPGAQRLPLADADKPVAEKITFSEIHMSRARNMLGHELTYAEGIVANESNRTVKDVEVTVEFLDALGQVVLRDVQRPLGKNPAPLRPGEKRGFQLTFESVSSEWNRQLPHIRVTGLLLE